MKILYVEDEIAHVMLTERVLEESLHDGFKLIHAETIETALKLLDAEPDIDVVLTDLRLPDGTGLDLLLKVRERNSPPAIVLVTGQGDQEVAVTALKSGAADYLVKQSDYLHRLPVVISNAIAQNRYLREQQALHRAEGRYRSLVEQITAVVFLDQIGEEQTTIYMSPRIEELTGYTAEEWCAGPKLWLSSIHPDDRDRIIKKDIESNQSGSRFLEEYRLIRRDGTIVWVKEDTNLIRDQEGQPLYWQGILLDITKEKESEAVLQRQLEELAVLHSASLAASSALEIDTLIEQVTNIIGDTLYPDNFGILLLNGAENTLKPHRSYRGTSPENLSAPFPITQGITGKVARTRKPLRAADVTKEGSYLAVTNGVQSELCVPIISRGQVIGVINSESKKENAYSEKDERLLTTIAHTLATATDKLRSFEEARQRATELEALYQASRSLALSLEPEIIGKNLVTTIDEMLGYEFASVYLLDDQAQSLALLAITQKARDPQNQKGDTPFFFSEKLPLDAGIQGWVAKHGQPIRVGDVSKEQRYIALLKHIKSALCVPLIARGKVIGVLNIESTDLHAYSERDENLLTALANSAAIALENARLYKSELARREQAETLRTATASLSAVLDVETLYERVLDSAAKLIPYDYGSIEIVKRECLELVAEHGHAKEPFIKGKDAWTSKRWEDWKDMWTDQHRPLVLSDIQGENSPIEKDQRFIRSWMRIPLVAGKRIFGLITLKSEQPNFFTEEQAGILQTFANQAGIAIEKAELYQEALQAAERRAVLHRISQDIVRFTQDSEQIYRAIHEAAQKLMRCDVFMISLHDEKRKQNIAVYTVEMGNRYSPEAAAADRGLTAFIINGGNSIILKTQAEIEQRNVLHFGSPRHVQSVVAVPLRVNDQRIGMITAQSYESYAYDLEEQTLLEMLATHAATAIENNRLFELEQKRRQEAENLRQAAAVISSTLDTDNVVRQILRALKQVIPYDNASVFFHEGDQLRIAMAHGYPHAQDLTNSSYPADNDLFQILRESHRPILLEDAQKDTRFKSWGGAYNVHGWMAIPLVARGEVIGFITLDSNEPGIYNESIIETAMAFANQAAAGIDNARLFQEQSRRSRIIEALADIANDIATTREVLPALDQITRRALDLLHANHVAIYLLQDDGITLKTVAAHGAYRNELLSHTRKIGEGITGNVFLKGKPEIVNDTSEDPRRVVIPGTPDEESRVESLMSSPLNLRGKSIGVINAWRLKRDGLFNESELNFLVGIAHQVSICIESGRLFQETNRQAQEAAAIAEVGRDISATLQLDTVLERISSSAMVLLHAETSAVYLANEAALTLQAIAALGIDSEALKRHPLTLGKGILGNIALQSQGEIVNDTASDPRTIIVKGTEKNLHENLMAVPILLKDKHMGLLAVWRSGVGSEFTARELEFLTSLARQTAVAIENARLFKEVERRLKELETINRISMSLRMTQSLNEMLPILLNETLHLTGTPHGSIWLYDHTSDKLIQRVARGMETHLKHKSLSPMEGIIGYTFRTGKTYHATELKNDSLLFEGERDSMTPGYGAICIPIQSTAGSVGVLAVVIEAERQITEVIPLLLILAEITGNSIHRAQLYDQSQRQVRRLTSLRDIDSAISSSFDLRLTLNILMDQTVSHLNVDAVNIGLYHPDLQSLTYLNGVGFTISSPTRPPVRMGEGLAGQVLIRQQICHITNLQNAPEASNEVVVKREGFVTYIGIPLIVKGQIKGVFEVFHRSPLSPTPDWMEFLHTLAGQAAIAIDSAQLFENLQRSNQELIQAYDTTLEGWARALELRDRETEGHTRRVTEMTMRLARYIGVNDNDMVNIYRGVLLHDIGKMGVPDHILKKEGKLTEEEWAEMRKHPVYAYNLLSPISFLRGVLDIPYCHHERWDGKGYPRGLKGEQIPLAARIFSVVDNWDALLSDRPYRKAWPVEKVKAYLRESAGTLLDPSIVEIFLSMVEQDEIQTR
ncbi:MAG TPA: GAF domain-containing protein [Anaerolineales bacterium]|jgi:PAS domain S-box-containing protein|nr:GAF domain-containing protein [Anaerolineales bacterium]